MKPPPAGRFLPIDAMRGIASVMVLVFHLFRSPPQVDVLAATFPAPLEIVSDFSRSGIAIFFVISGFVIAYTTRNLSCRVRDSTRFALRRQVRLDPPYYAAMAFVLATMTMERLVPGLDTQSVTPGDVVLNMFYLQGIAGAPSVLAVAWTLCLEVQFYLVVVLLVLTSGALVRRTGPPAARDRLVRIGALTLGAVSLALPFFGHTGGPWFIGTWWMFCIGMTLAWFMTGGISRSTILTLVVIVGVWCVAVTVWSPLADPWGAHWFAWLAMITILVLIMTRSLSRRPARALVYLGTLSYSLYLVHLPVIDVVMAGAYKLTGDSTAGALAAYGAGAVVSFAAAIALHRFVEQPAMRWSDRLKTAPLRPRLPAKILARR